MPAIQVRRGTPDPTLDRDAFARRFRTRFDDPAFAPFDADLERLLAVAWEAYQQSRKSPVTRPAGLGYADPAYELSDEWRQASEAIKTAERRQKDPASGSRILLISGAARSEHSCPGEMSKTFRLMSIAQKLISAEDGYETEVLDLSRLAAEYGRVIYPCKSCVSTAMPLCHWPCSCYPNHALGQTGDWMNEIYPMWVAAHGVMIVCPVNWYQAPSALKLMIDRLVCADGGNPDPTSTGGKNAERAKALELKGWSYPRHLAGRAFSVVVHGDAAGVETLSRSLSNWLTDMELVPAGAWSELGRYIGYLEPYATSHDALDREAAIVEEVQNAARALVEAVRNIRSGAKQPGSDLQDPRPK